jgi:hypothetical protein
VSRALQLCALMALSYFLLVLNTRAIAEGSRVGVALSDIAIASANFFILQQVAGAKTRGEFVGYVIGGLVGSLLALEASLRGWL